MSKSMFDCFETVILHDMDLRRYDSSQASNINAQVYGALPMLYVLGANSFINSDLCVDVRFLAKYSYHILYCYCVENICYFVLYDIITAIFKH